VKYLKKISNHVGWNLLKMMNPSVLEKLKLKMSATSSIDIAVKK
jgi:hypothetical protein